MVRAFAPRAARGTIPLVADVSAPTGRTVKRDHLTEKLAWRLSVLGAATLGFLITFIALDHEIHSFKNVVLPLLAILPVYLVLMSITTWWAARSMAGFHRVPRAEAGMDQSRVRMWRVLRSCCGLAFGVLAAWWYVHWVSQ